ncbi:MAG: uracil-DNA glycosylase [Sneathiella sp.]|nr:uracil-DNA glycosylase [Sneathiella sp.]
MQMGSNISEILNFYLEAGVDEVISDQPVDQFALSSAPPTSPARAPRAKPASTARPATPVTGTQNGPTASINLSAEIEKAENLANLAQTLEELRASLDNFTGSALKSMAMNTVFSRGKLGAKLMIIDRAPGAEEDRQGVPFAAAKGELLSKMLRAIDINIDETYMAAALPWRPPGGQAPTKEDRALCLPFLKRHIELAAPEHLLLCGEAASIVLEREKTGINKLRGTWETIKIGGLEIPSLSLFHPAFLMDHPASKKLAWEDLLALKAKLNNIPH